MASHADIEVKAVALARMAVFMISTGLLVSTGPDIFRRNGKTSEKLNSLHPRKWTNTRRKEDVVDIDAGDKTDTLGSGPSPLVKGLRDHGRTHEHRASDDITSNKRDSPTDFVQEKDTENLADDTHGVVDTVDQEGAVFEADF